MIIPARDSIHGICIVDEDAEMGKVGGNGRGYDGVEGYPLLGTCDARRCG